MSKKEVIDGMVDTYMAIYDIVRQGTKARPELHSNVPACKDIAGSIFIEYNKKSSSNNNWGSKKDSRPKSKPRAVQKPPEPPKESTPDPPEKEEAPEPIPVVEEPEPEHIEPPESDDRQQNYMAALIMKADGQHKDPRSVVEEYLREYGCKRVDHFSYEEAEVVIGALEALS